MYIYRFLFYCFKIVKTKKDHKNFIFLQLLILYWIEESPFGFLIHRKKRAHKLLLESKLSKIGIDGACV